MSELQPKFTLFPNQYQALAWFNPTERKRNKKQPYPEAPGATTFMNMGRYAIDLAVRSEPDPLVRLRKRINLLAMWRQYSRDVIRVARSRRRLW